MKGEGQFFLKEFCWERVQRTGTADRRKCGIRRSFFFKDRNVTMYRLIRVKE